MKTSAIIFGQKLKEYRIKKNITQEELALKIGLRPSYISDLERGHRPDPRLSTVLLILGGLDVGFDQFLLRTK